MLRCTDLSMLPPFTNRVPTKTRYSLPHNFNSLDGVRIVKDHSEPKSFTPFPCSVYGKPAQPSWMFNEKKVLCFYAYLKETMTELHETPYQVRKVKILYYLADGTIQIEEPRVPNSGIAQGGFVSRQRIPRKRHSGLYLNEFDLNVNKCVEIFDRIFHITSCDEFTRCYLKLAGVIVPEPIPMPADPYILQRQNEYKLVVQSKRPQLGAGKLELKQFLENDRKVLRFYGYWDDRAKLFGDVHDVELNYFMADDTIEVKDLCAKKIGRDCRPIFVKRGKLPKKFKGLPIVGETCSSTVLNIYRGRSTVEKYVNDRLNIGEQSIEFYMDKDLAIGKTLDVFNRNVVLIDCDEFTKNFYRLKYGIEDFHPAPHIQPMGPCPPIRFVMPPHNGYGSFEDSEVNCKKIELKPPFADFRKMLAYDNCNLKFGAKMVTSIKDDLQRIFIITYYLGDDTISIYEYCVRNSGFAGGFFFKRMKFYLPGEGFYQAERPKYYMPYDFYIGRTIVMNSYKFYICSAEEFTLAYMEMHPNVFAKSNISIIMSKVREALRHNYKNVIAGYLDKVSEAEINGQQCLIMASDMLRSILVSLLQDSITEHEIITICRHFSTEHKQRQMLDREMLKSIVQTELRRKLWYDFVRFKGYIIHLNPEGCTHLPMKIIRVAILACHLPLKDNLLDKLFHFLNKDADGNIELYDFYNFIDPNAKFTPIEPKNFCADVPSKIPVMSPCFLNFDSFLNYIGLEDKIQE